MLRDPVIQSTRLMPTEEEGVGSQEGEGQGEESENPLVGPGITITQPDKIQSIKVSHDIVHETRKWLCLLLGFGLPEQANGWLPLRFGIDSRRCNPLNVHAWYMYACD